MTTDQLIRRLRDVDPAADLPGADLAPDGLRGRRVRSQASQRAGNVPTSSGVFVRTPKKLRARALVGAGGLVTAAVAVAVMVPLGTSEAFASWSPEPDELSPAQIAARVDHCPDRFPPARVMDRS